MWAITAMGRYINEAARNDEPYLRRLAYIRDRDKKLNRFKSKPLEEAVEEFYKEVFENEAFSDTCDNRSDGSRDI